MKKHLARFLSAVFGVAVLGVASTAVAVANGNPVVKDNWQSGNATVECAAIGSYKYGYKIDNWSSEGEDGTYVHEGNSITISNSDSQTFDWSATDPIGAVIVKAGTGANVWFYNPQVKSGTNLYAYEERDISHATFCWNDEEEESEYYFQFAKKWTGDSVSPDGVKVVFKIGDEEWDIGDDPVPVEPGQVLSPLSEVVTGLPSNCTSTSDLPGSYTVPSELMDVSTAQLRDDEEAEEPVVYTLTATNTVKCTTTPPVQPPTTPPVTVVAGQVTQTPSGPVAAGAGMAVVSLVGLIGSTASIAAGSLLKKYGK